MDATEIAQTFQNEFRELITRSLKNSVPLALMVTSFDDAKLELQLMLLELRRENAAKLSAEADAISTGKIIHMGDRKLSLPPGHGNGH